MALTDEEFDARLKVLEKADDLIMEATNLLHASGFIPASHRLWWEAMQEMYDAWHDEVLEIWAKEEKRPGATGNHRRV